MAIGLSWVKTDGTTWHNGGAGGFSSFVGVRGDRAVCAIASHAATPTFSLRAQPLDRDQGAGGQLRGQTLRRCYRPSYPQT